MVLVRVHNGLPYPTDLLLHLLALMEEVSEVGMHFWLLYQEVRQEPDQCQSMRFNDRKGGRSLIPTYNTVCYWLQIHSTTGLH